MAKHDRIPRISIQRWTAPMPCDETDAGGWAIAFTWLGFMVELGAGRRAWWHRQDGWADTLRELKGLPMAEQHSRLMNGEVANG